MAIDTRSMADDTIALVERVARDWGAEFVRTRRAEVNRLRVRSTGALHDSIRYELRKPRRGRWVIRVSYNFYGKFHDKGIKNTLPQGGRAYIASLTEWVQRKGLNNFTPRRSGSSEQQARDIAWGIARSNAQPSPWKRRKWLNPMRPDVDRLSDSIEKILPDAIVQDVIRVLTTR